MKRSTAAQSYFYSNNNHRVRKESSFKRFFRGLRQKVEILLAERTLLWTLALAGIALTVVSFFTTYSGLYEFLVDKKTYTSIGGEQAPEKIQIFNAFLAGGTTFGIQIALLAISIVLGHKLAKTRVSPAADYYLVGQPVKASISWEKKFGTFASSFVKASLWILIYLAVLIWSTTFSFHTFFKNMQNQTELEESKLSTMRESLLDIWISPIYGEAKIKTEISQLKSKFNEKLTEYSNQIKLALDKLGNQEIDNQENSMYLGKISENKLLLSQLESMKNSLKQAENQQGIYNTKLKKLREYIRYIENTILEEANGTTCYEYTSTVEIVDGKPKVTHVDLIFNDKGELKKRAQCAHSDKAAFKGKRHEALMLHKKNKKNIEVEQTKLNKQLLGEITELTFSITKTESTIKFNEEYIENHEQNLKNKVNYTLDIKTEKISDSQIQQLSSECKDKLELHNDKNKLCDSKNVIEAYKRYINFEGSLKLLRAKCSRDIISSGSNDVLNKLANECPGLSPLPGGAKYFKNNIQKGKRENLNEKGILFAFGQLEETNRYAFLALFMAITVDLLILLLSFIYATWQKSPLSRHAHTMSETEMYDALEDTISNLSIEQHSPISHFLKHIHVIHRVDFPAALRLSEIDDVQERRTAERLLIQMVHFLARSKSDPEVYFLSGNLINYLEERSTAEKAKESGYNPEDFVNTFWNNHNECNSKITVDPIPMECSKSNLSQTL